MELKFERFESHMMKCKSVSFTFQYYREPGREVIEKKVILYILNA